MKTRIIVLSTIFSLSCGNKNIVDNKPFVNSVGMTMCPIPAGSFMRGTDDGFWEERPAHKVTISTPFYSMRQVRR